MNKLIDPKSVAKFKPAIKIGVMHAKHISAIIPDKELLDKVLFVTLEGNESIRPDIMICRGIAGELYPQTSKKLLAKYNLDSIEADGWFKFVPKLLPALAWQQTEYEKFMIIAQWGEDYTLESGDAVKVQYGRQGDYILNTIGDPNDFYIVKEEIFEKTYAFQE